MDLKMEILENKEKENLKERQYNYIRSTLKKYCDKHINKYEVDDYECSEGNCNRCFIDDIDFAIFNIIYYEDIKKELGEDDLPF